ncbi:amidohydrolase family protein [Verrucomicrobiota bacterium]
MAIQSGTLLRAINEIPLCDTHEHLAREYDFIEKCTDVLICFFNHYPNADLRSAGATDEAMTRLLDGQDSDIADRFAGVEDAWQAIRNTGYGEAVLLAARKIYDIDEITPDSLAAAQPKHEALLKEGERLRLLRDVAGLDHVQIDRQKRQCPPDRHGPEFFLADMGLSMFCRGEPDPAAFKRETDTELADLASYRRGLETIFERNASLAIALKSAHAYGRTLRWRKRSDADAEAALKQWLADPENCGWDARLALGDWAWARCAELSIEYNLPFKMHTGYNAGVNSMRMEWIDPSQTCDLFVEYPKARFVLMHASWPYQEQLIALTKHFTNVYADLCWAWSMGPATVAGFVRHYLHAAPANKLFAFGGDTDYAVMSVGYAMQARKWLAYALETEVREGWIDEKRALQLARMVMRENQYACFDIEGRRKALQAVTAAGGPFLDDRPEAS